MADTPILTPHEILQKALELPGLTGVIILTKQENIPQQHPQHDPNIPSWNMSTSGTPLSEIVEQSLAVAKITFGQLKGE